MWVEVTLRVTLILQISFVIHLQIGNEYEYENGYPVCYIRIL